ncbi:hypothetical protein IMZ11_28980 [Microtetraspora sp. AC03309]|uniref:hypothetical protein n=1 Tax=Microtetraspora sp. AC03309 TaxID=2779376 RepID=UPI001E5D0B5A|nr:hypothetical protein [Microtetraspora sp. AC03309]MCC5579670.1 hypothetical protein [Microtetraspora sp. AC03309]
MRITRTLAIAAVALAAAATPTAAHAQASSASIAYHGITSAQQVQKFHELSGKGYVPVSLSISSGPSYAGVWVKSSGAAWAMYQDMSSQGYQKRFDEYTAKGYQPTVVTATGSGDAARFAAVFVKKSGSFMAQHNMTTDQLITANLKAQAKGLMMTSIDVYGTDGAPTYAAIWTPNASGVKWHLTYDLSSADHENAFKIRVSNGYRPAYVAVDPGGTFTTIWRNDKSGSWYEYTGMSSSGYQSRFDKLKTEGYFPVQVNSEDGKYAAIWTK